MIASNPRVYLHWPELGLRHLVIFYLVFFLSFPDDGIANSLRHAAYLLSEAGIARVSDEDIVRIVDTWYPSCESSYLCFFWTEMLIRYLASAVTAIGAADATGLECHGLVHLWSHCGQSVHVTSHKVNTSVLVISDPLNVSYSQLTEIAKSIALYLHDEFSPYRALAIDLGSLGFAIWQQYVDVVQMLRALFALATSTKKETISVHNVGQLARTAVLHIASANTPLFMTTLSMDILQPRNVQHRKSIMQLVVFLIRKVGIFVTPHDRI